MIISLKNPPWYSSVNSYLPPSVNSYLQLSEQHKPQSKQKQWTWTSQNPILDLRKFQSNVNLHFFNNSKRLLFSRSCETISNWWMILQQAKSCRKKLISLIWFYTGWATKTVCNLNIFDKYFFIVIIINFNAKKANASTWKCSFWLGLMLKLNSVITVLNEILCKILPYRRECDK